MLRRISTSCIARSSTWRPIRGRCRPNDVPERVTELLAAARELAVDNVRQAGGDASQVAIDVQVPELLTIEVARHLIVMTLANVLKNALEACIALAGERDGVVQIVAAQQDGVVEIRITDNGIGMSQEEKIGWSEFIPGRRNKSKRLSTGYGLPDCRPQPGGARRHADLGEHGRRGNHRNHSYPCRQR